MDRLNNSKESEKAMSGNACLPHRLIPGYYPAATVERVLQGGSWHRHALRAQTTARGMNDPWFTDDDVGFRLALSP